MAAAQAGIHVLVGLIEDEQGRLLVNRRRPGTSMAGAWEFPGGKLDPGETRLQALRRELAEELGIAVVAATPMLELTHDYPDKRVTLDVWWVDSYTGVAFGREQQELRWVEIERLADLGLLPADLPIIDALHARRAQTARPS
jgi:8-oxo-dGTP diphosphatase